MRMLCVDDDPTFLKLVSAMLEKVARPDDEVLSAATGAEGLAALETGPMDIVITDLKLPDMTGIDILHAAKELHPPTEVLLVTASASVNTAVEAMKGGARDYIVKPVKMDALSAKVETLRDLVERADEAEEYRYAKEMIEESAHDAVEELETRLGAAAARERRIRDILDDDADDAELLRRIREALESDRA